MSKPEVGDWFYLHFVAIDWKHICRVISIKGINRFTVLCDTWKESDSEYLGPRFVIFPLVSYMKAEFIDDPEEQAMLALRFL